MANHTSNSSNIFETVPIYSFTNNYEKFLPERCKTCSLIMKDNLLTMISINSIKFNVHEISLRDKLYFCCPELDLRINTQAMLCINCFETINIIYEFIRKCDPNKSKLQEQFSLPFKSIQKRSYIGKDEIKIEDVNLYDAEEKPSRQDAQIESSTKPFKCSMCNYSSTTKGNFLRHFRIHSGEKPFKCSVCDYSSTNKNNLKNHLRIHTGEKPFKCSVCDYTSSTKSQLKYHLGTHSAEKPFKCSICIYNAVTKSSLKKHLRIHSGKKPFKCSVCDYRGNTKGNLHRHLRIHSGEKPFKCSMCNYSSTNKNNLKNHLRVHTGEKPFQCSVCDYSSNTKSNLKRHLSIHSEEKPFKKYNTMKNQLQRRLHVA